MLGRSRKKVKNRCLLDKAKGRESAAKITAILLAVIFAFAFLPTGSAVNAEAGSVKTKSETVYAILSDDGTYSGATVVNCFTIDGQIIDYGKYTSITNLMGSDSPTVEGEKIIWDADVTGGQKSFYYQGETQKPLPFDIAIKYFLNGVKTNPQDIAGKSGELKIAFEIKNRAGTGQIDELVDKQVYTPFAVQVSAAFDSDIFTIIDIPQNATSMRTGSSYTIAYSSFPLPEDEFSFTMFGQGIKMDPINIVVLPKAPPGLDSYSDFIDTDEMSEGTDEMIDGTDEMSDGTDELLGALYEMKDAAKDMQSGLEDLRGGAQELEGGMDMLYSNARKLSSSASDFYDGMSVFAASFAAFDQGMGELYTGVLDMASSLSGLNDLVIQLDNGIISMGDGLDTALATFDDVKAAVDDLEPYISAIPGYPGTIYTAMAVHEAGLNALASAGTGLETLSAGVRAGTGDFYTEFSTTFAGNVSALRTSSGALYASCLELLNGADGINGACDVLKGAVKELSQGAKGLGGGADEAADNIPELINAIDDMIDGVLQLQDGIVELQEEGLLEMKDSFEGLDGYLQTLADKADEYGSFMDERNAKTSTVQFVIKTGGISMEEEETAPVSADSEKADGFFDKLKDLF